jgi:hypothetical protein
MSGAMDGRPASHTHRDKSANLQIADPQIAYEILYLSRTRP